MYQAGWDEIVHFDGRLVESLQDFPPNTRIYVSLTCLWKKYPEGYKLDEGFKSRGIVEHNLTRTQN